VNIYETLQMVVRLERVNKPATRYSLAKAHNCSYSKITPMCLLLENLGMVKVRVYQHRPNVTCRQYKLSMAGEKVVMLIDAAKHQGELPF
jgi:hypothetical protein